ncbi:MAG: hypothetical protein KJ906_03620 [Nanoarchaeota archaeon]|nr:hypothetical protein [Nanoarchaeota archaeon]
MVTIVKRNGKKQKFSKAKIIKGCMKAGATKKIASAVANTVSKKVFEGMSARRIGELAIIALRKKDKKIAVSYAKNFNKRWK